MGRDSASGTVSIRTDLRPGDVGAVVALHGTVYARERGWGATFEAYVAGPLAEFVLAGSARQRIWIAERDGEVVGCVAIVAAAALTAQLRWFLLHPSARGVGLGKKLLRDALAFCQECGYAEV